MIDMDELAARAGLVLFPYQRKYLESIQGSTAPTRTCLYYRTGAGKTFTALAGMRLQGYEDVLVVAPPSTHKQWEGLADRLGMDIDCMSHAKFRMKGTLLSRHMPVIADEMHLFGGQQGQGWRKLDRLCNRVMASVVLMSATPNYNDAERVYCVQHILDPHGTKGGYLQFLYTHCVTRQNPFGMEPLVEGFKNYPDAASYLADMAGVHHLPDERVVDIDDIAYDPDLPSELETYGYNRRDHSMVASRIEGRHVARVQGLVGELGLIRPNVVDEILKVLRREGSILIYANHATVAKALARTFDEWGVEHALVTGSTSKKNKEEIIFQFNHRSPRVLIGTASLATGTDGMDRVCDTLLILDDTDDDALRQQLIGRILPRGDMVPMGHKKVFRLIPS